MAAAAAPGTGRPVLALYRRYRPDTFADVIGQDHVVAPLSAAIAKGRVNHAYLFSGPRGCGKTTSARVLARSLNCAQGPTPAPCGVCASCVDLARGGPGSLDVIEIDAASHRGIDDARDLRDRVTFAPVRDRFKVVIIDEAHQITTEGFNALLKVVEEPPDHVVFVFATTEPEKVLGTIRSRTHHYPFRLVPPRRLLPYLEQLCRDEGVAVAPGALALVLRAGGGSVRDTLSVLDQLVAGAGAEGVDLEAAADLLGYVPESLLDDMVDALAAVDGAAAFGVVHRAVEGGHDPRRFAHDLLERLRALVVVSRVGDAAEDLLPDQPPDAVDRLRAQAGRFGVAELSRAADIVATSLSDMAGATSPRLLVELLVARLLVVGSEAAAVVAARLDRLERQVQLVSGGTVGSRQPGGGTTDATAGPTPASAATGAPTSTATEGSATPSTAAPEAPAPPPRAQPAPAEPPPASPGNPEAGTAPPVVAEPIEVPAPSPSAPVHAAPAAAGTAHTVGVETLRRSWDTVTDTVRELKRLTWTLISQNAQVLSLDEHTLTLGFATQGLVDAFTTRGHPAVVREALLSSFGIDRTVVAAVSPRGDGDHGPPGPPAPPTAPAAESPAAVDEAPPDDDWPAISGPPPSPRRTPAARAGQEPAPAPARPGHVPGGDGSGIGRTGTVRTRSGEAPGAAAQDAPRRPPDDAASEVDLRADSVDLPDGDASGQELLERVLGGRVIAQD